MVERIYDALKGLLYVQFPRNSAGYPAVYDRKIKNWYLGERNVIPDDLSIVIHNESSTDSDYSFGERLLEYSFTITSYCSGDDSVITARIASECARIIRNVLTSHKRIWIMEPCPICGKLPSNPIHYFSDSAHQAIFGNYGDQTGPYGAAGTVYSNFLNNWYQTHYALSPPGNLIYVNVLNPGSYISAPNVSFTGGGSGSVSATAHAILANGGVGSVVVDNPGYMYTATPSVIFAGGAGSGASGSAVISAPDPSGVATDAFYQVYNAIISTGNFPSALTSVQIQRFKDLINTKTQPIRIVFDVQLSSFTATDEALGNALLSKGTFSLKMKEIIPVNNFGPNYTGINYDPKGAY